MVAGALRIPSFVRIHPQVPDPQVSGRIRASGAYSSRASAVRLLTPRSMSANSGWLSAFVLP